MKKYRKLIPLLLLSVFLLNGCLIKSGDELLQLPKPAENYLALQNQLDRVLKKGASYAAPEAGEYRSTIQLRDVDGDGEDEAIVFFRESDNNGKFSVYLYKKEEDQYVLTGRISGTGTAVYSVDYPQIDSAGNRAIAVSWTLGSDLNRGMTVCMLQNGEFTSLLDTEYTAYTFVDLDQDGKSELLTFVPDDQGRQAAKLFQLADGKMEEISNLSLHKDRAIMRLTQGMMADHKIAVYADQKSNSGTGFFTDILVYHNGALVNLSEETADIKMDTYRSLMIYTRDMNQDGVMEVPQIASTIIPASGSGITGDPLYLLNWYQYSMGKAPQKVSTCFANLTDHWILKCPDSWQKGVTAISRDGSDGKSCIRFQTTDTQPVGLAEIYKIEENSWSHYMEQADYIMLGMQDHYVYAAKLLESPADNARGLSEYQIKQLFSVISGDWVS